VGGAPLLGYLSFLFSRVSYCTGPAKRRTKNPGQSVSRTSANDSFGKGKNAARRVVRHAEFRSLPPLKRALKLSNEVPLNQTEISEVCGIFQIFSIEQKAQKEGHKPGNTRRSHLLSEEEIVELEKFWKEKHKALIVLTIEELIHW
jgi:hypothetical protein